MSTYSQKLRDPRWQKKRLEIMDRDKFQCQRCEATDKTLNVHHRKYLRGREPWEYPDEFLVTLCEDCHAAMHPKKSRHTSRPLNLKAPGFVITWTAFPDNDVAAWDILEWTGTTMRYNHPERNEIYVCLDKYGRKISIDQSDGRFFNRPTDYDIKFDDKDKPYELIFPADDDWVKGFLSAMLDGIKHGADFEDGKPNGPHA